MIIKQQSKETEVAGFSFWLFKIKIFFSITTQEDEE